MMRIIIKCFVKEGTDEEFIKWAGLLAEKARLEEGCISYQICQDARIKTTIALVEEWESFEKLEKHLKKDYFKELSDKCVQLQEKDSEYGFYNIVA